MQFKVCFGQLFEVRTPKLSLRLATPENRSMAAAGARPHVLLRIQCLMTAGCMSHSTWHGGSSLRGLATSISLAHFPRRRCLMLALLWTLPTRLDRRACLWWGVGSVQIMAPLQCCFGMQPAACAPNRPKPETAASASLLTMSGLRRAPPPACNTDSAEHRVPRALFVTQAAMNGNERAVKLLLRKGVNVNHRDQYLQTACMWVVLLPAAGFDCTVAST